jgi:uncharacterized protein YkuJ
VLYTTCQRIHDLHLRPYRLQLVHELLPNDQPRRQQFCQWFENFHNNGTILAKIFFSNSTPVVDVDDFRQRITNKFEEINN